MIFIYLFSNQRASVTGLYELLIKIISLVTGLDRSVILRAFEVYTVSIAAPALCGSGALCDGYMNS
jgi:hypothetical protein